MVKKDFIRSGSHAMIAGIAQQGFAMLHFLLIARWLTVESLGTWAMFLTLISFVEMARLGLIQNALIRFGAQYPNEKSQIATAALILSVGLSVLGAILLLILSFILRTIFDMPDLPHLLAGYIFLSFINALLRLLDGLRIADKDFLTPAISAAIFGGAFLLLTIIMYVFNQQLTLYALLYSQIVASVCTLLIIFTFIKRVPTFGSVNRVWLSRLFSFGRYGMGTNLASMIFQRADMLILGSFVSPASLAIYNVATRIVTYLDFPLNQLGLVLLPEMAAISTVETHKMYEKTVAMLLAITLPITIMAFLGADILVTLMAGKEYGAAVPLLQIMLLASLVKPFGRVFGIFLDVIGKPDWNFKMLLVSMFVTFTLNIALISPYFIGGTEGAAWASALSVIVTICIGQLLLVRRFPIRLQSIMHHIIPTYRFILKKRL